MQTPFIPLQQATSTIATIIDQTRDNLLRSVTVSNGYTHQDINAVFAPLPITFYDDAINTQLKPVFDSFPNLELAYFLEVAFRLHLLAVQGKLATQLAELKINLFQTLDLLLRCHELGLCDDGVPLALMEEVLDLQTIDHSEPIYEYLELRKERLTAGMEPTRGKGPTLLRLCNELLRRLSKAKNTVFCGRILVFLASAFPPSEKSGVNNKGEYNVENITVIEDEDKAIVPEMSDFVMDVDEGKRESSTSTTTTTTQADWEFYRQFWGLQEFFSNPGLLANFPDNQAALRKGMEDALRHFTEVNDERRRRMAAKEKTATTATAVSTDAKEDSKEDTKEAMVPRLKRKHVAAFGSRAAAEAASSTYFPKFLTSPTLLKLEISDPYFRRHILLQFLVMTDILMDHAEDTQKDWSKVSNKSMIPSWHVDTTMGAWATDIRKRIGRELVVTSMSASGSGRDFTKTVKNVLIHEKSWQQWKAENCQPFERTRMDPADVSIKDANRKKQKTRIEPVQFRRSMGCASLTELWETSVEDEFWDEVMFTNSQMPKDAVDDYLNGLAREDKMIPTQRRNRGMPMALTEEERQEKDKARMYRSLRLGSEFYLHLYNQVVNAPNGIFTTTDLMAAIKKDKELEKEIKANGGKLPPKQPPQQPSQSQQPAQATSSATALATIQTTATDETVSASVSTTTTAISAGSDLLADEGKENSTTPAIVLTDDERVDDKNAPAPQDSAAMEIDQDRPEGLGIVIKEDGDKKDKIEPSAFHRQ